MRGEGGIEREDRKGGGGFIRLFHPISGVLKTRKRGMRHKNFRTKFVALPANTL